MAFFQNKLADRIVGAVASSSPGTGWTSVADFPTLVLNARTANLPLVLLPGTYTTTQIDIATGTGGGNPLVMTGAVGSVIVQLSASAAYLMRVNGVSGVSLEGVIFDGGNQNLTEANQFAALLRFSGNITYTVRKCTIRNSPKSGIGTDSGAIGVIRDNWLSSLNYGVSFVDCGGVIDNNSISGCANGGVYVWNGSKYAVKVNITDNYIQNIASGSGNGQNGNGVSIYRASSVSVTGNTIYQCALSFIRVNGGDNCVIEGNKCWSANETGIFVEAPSAGLDTIGGVVSNNIVDTCLTGIIAVNIGLYGDGVCRRINISNNQVRNATGSAFLAEGGCVLTGNTAEGSAIGIVLGTNNATSDVAVVGNYVKSCQMGIGYSADSAAKGMLISSNLISGYVVSTNPGDPAYARSGAIVSAYYNGAATYRVYSGAIPNTDYGNATQTQVGALTVGMNAAHN